MAERLLQEDKSDYDNTCFENLEKKVECVKESAFQNFNNQLLNATYYEIDYIKMWYGNYTKWIRKIFKKKFINCKILQIFTNNVNIHSGR